MRKWRRPLSKNFKDATSSLEEVQTFPANRGNYEIFESLENVIDSVASVQSIVCTKITDTLCIKPVTNVFSLSSPIMPTFLFDV